MKKLKILHFMIYITIMSIISGNLFAQMRLKDKYYLGSFGCGMYNSPGAIYFYDQNSQHWNNYIELNFNLNHQYLPGGMTWDYEQLNPPTIPLMVGSFYDDIRWYNNNLSNVFHLSYDNHNIKLILERFKSEYAGYGQRSTYQAEEYDENGIKCITKRPGYGYRYSNVGIDIMDNTQNPPIKVKYCNKLTDAPQQFIVYSLFENCEQVNSIHSDLRFSDVKSGLNPPYRWYIKPRMKIAGWENLDPNTPVVRIDVIAYDGITQILSYPLLIKDFFDDSGNYHGEYKEMYFENQNPPLTIYPLSVTGADLNIGNPGGDASLSKVDYRVLWYGNVDIYLDYVRVDDEWAHFLFNPELDVTHKWDFIPKIISEANAFKSSKGFGQFYVDEFFYNNIECIQKTKEIIETATDGQLTIEPSYNFNMLNCRNSLKYDNECIDGLISKGLIKDFIRTGIYPFCLNPYYMRINCPPNLIYNDNTGGSIDPIMITLYNKRSLNSENYNDSIELKLESFSNQGNNNYFISQMHTLRMTANAIVRARDLGKNIIFSYQDQAHSDEFNMENYNSNNDIFCWREPSNEEISFQSFLGMAYGAKQILHYDYNVEQNQAANGYNYHLYGLAKNNGDKRHENVFQYSNGLHQDKWNYVKDLDIKLKAIGDYLYPSGEINKHKYYIESRTVNTFPDIIDLPPYFSDPRGLNNPTSTYISNIQSFGRNPQNHLLWDQQDPDAKRYWELGFFENNPNDNDLSEKYSHYFIAVNKRCTPESPNNLYDGDLRNLKIKFNPNDQALAGFSNWKIIDPISGTTFATFDKNSSDFYDAGIFQPGEGKLFKIAPVLQEGGTFVTHELLGTFPDLHINCKGDVYANNKSLIFYNATIEFNNNCGLYIDGGTLMCEADPSHMAYLKAVEGAKWYGIDIQHAEQVDICNTVFKNIIAGVAVDIFDCTGIWLQGNQFIVDDSQGNLIGGFAIYNISDEGYDTYIKNNIINVNNAQAAAYIEYQSVGSGYLYFENNNINVSSNGYGNIGCFLTNIGALKFYNNTINGFDIGINALNCIPELYKNSIYSSNNNSTGINAAANSRMMMTNIYTYLSGGFNYITNTGSDCYNIKLNTANFWMDQGRNHFTISYLPNNENINGYGQFPVGYDRNIYARNNCFNGQNGVAYCTIWDDYGELNFISSPYDCPENPNPDPDFVVQLENNIRDTVYKRSLNNNQDSSYALKLYQELYLYNRKKNYDSVNIIATILLNNYNDSIYCPDVIAKLYLSTINLDSTGIKMQNLKTFYEQLILNNSNDTVLIISANYFIQKCKVYLEQYTSALIGFQDIINQNPYSYEGLLASWDYAATLLLMDTLNSSGGMSSIDELNEMFTTKDGIEFLIDSLRIKKLMRNDNYNRKVFTPSDRQILFKTTGSVFTGERIKQIEKFKVLEKKSSEDNGKEGIKSKRELADLKALNEAVKVKRPKNQKEYIKIVNDDIKNVFKNKSKNDSKESGNIIPTKYELYQNYPNPFNPITKISFDLPKAGNVKLIVYDILGREITRLLNSEFKPAGKYIMEFNAINLGLASGVYFYRIETDKFIAVKKMVLIK